MQEVHTATLAELEPEEFTIPASVHEDSFKICLERRDIHGMTESTIDHLIKTGQINLPDIAGNRHERRAATTIRIRTLRKVRKRLTRYFEKNIDRLVSITGAEKAVAA